MRNTVKCYAPSCDISTKIECDSGCPFRRLYAFYGLAIKSDAKEDILIATKVVAMNIERLHRPYRVQVSQ